VLLVIDQVIESESVVTGYEIDASFGLPLHMRIDVGTADETGGHRAHCAGVRFDEGSHVVSNLPFHSFQL
jgi:hypothetical protein